MKKILTFFLLVSFMMWGMGVALLPVSAQETVVAGSIIKTADSSALYYVGEDNKIYVFPNASTYFSWFDEFVDIIVVSEEAFGGYELGNVVYYQPGSLLLKTQSSLKVYAIGVNGELRWIESEDLAREYYGDNWNLLVDDIADGFFTNYFMGESIDESEDYDPDLVSEEIPTISHNKGFKTRVNVQGNAQKRCANLKNSVNKLQKRAERWGMKVPSLGDDYIEACIGGVAQEEGSLDDDTDTDDVDTDSEDLNGNGNGNRNQASTVGKTDVCKIAGNSGKSHTINISLNALKKHIRAGYTIGQCVDDDGDDGDDGVLEISYVTVSEVTTQSAKITWTTTLVADSSVEYDVVTPFTSTSTEEDATGTTSHEIVLDGLSPDTTHYFNVSSSDADSSVSLTGYSFTTEALDTVAPIFFNIATSSVAAETATITWDTNEPATSKIVYAAGPTDTTATSSESSSGLVEFDHSLDLNNLATSTVYYFYLEGVDGSGNEGKSDEFWFETLTE